MHSVQFRDLEGNVRTGTWTDGEIVASDDTYLPESVDILLPTVPSKVGGVARNYPSDDAATSTGLLRRGLVAHQHPINWAKQSFAGDGQDEGPDRPGLFL